MGASGQIGRNAAASLRARGWDVVGTRSARAAPELLPLDLRDEGAIRSLVREVRPDLCVLSAALTNVDRCEEEPTLAERVNARAPQVVAAASREAGAPVVYLSTEYVFDGTAGPYAEDDPACPISVYGATKLAGERHVLAADPRNLSVRTTVVFSFHEGDANFAMQLLRRLGAGERMRVPRDQVSTPTYGPDLGEAIAQLVDGGASGVVNVVGPDLLDRHELACRAARALGLPGELLEPVETAALGQRARRPLRAGLRTDRLAALGIAARGVDEALADFARRAGRAAAPPEGPA